MKNKVHTSIYLTIFLLSLIIAAPSVVRAAATSRNVTQPPTPPHGLLALAGPPGSAASGVRSRVVKPYVPSAPLEGPGNSTPVLNVPEVQVSYQGNSHSQNTTASDTHTLMAPHVADTTWDSDPTRLTTIDYNAYFVTPRVAFDAEGAEHIVYAHETGTNLDKPEIYYITNRGGSWSAPVLIGGATHSRWPRMIIGPDQHIHVVIPDGYGHHIYYVEGVISGSGVVWSQPVLIGDCTGPAPGQADIATDDAGNVHVSFWQGMLPGDQASSVQYYRSRTRTGVWSPIITLPSFIGKHLDIRLAASGGLGGEPVRVYTAFSSDNGSNYQRDYDLYYLDGEVVPGTGAFIVRNGPYNMSSTPGMLSYDTSMAFDHVDRTLHLLWTENQPGQLNGNVYYRRSLDLGGHWSGMTNISGLQNTYDLESDLVARGGVVYMVWNCNWEAVFVRSYTTASGKWSGISDALSTLPNQSWWADTGAVFTPSMAVRDDGQAIMTYQAGRVESRGGGYGIWQSSGNTKVAVNTYYAPYVANGGEGYASQIDIFNPTNSDGVIFATFYTRSGTRALTQTRYAPAHSHILFDQRDGALPGPGSPGGAYVGHASIVSTVPLAGSVDLSSIFTPGSAGYHGAMAYALVPQLSTSLELPTTMKSAYGGYSTGMNIQNPNPVMASVTLNIYNNGGAGSTGPNGSLAESIPLAIPAFGSVGVYNGADTRLPEGFAGSARLTSSLPIAANINEINVSGADPNSGMSYAAEPTPRSGSMVTYLPAAFRLDSNGKTSGGQVTDLVGFNVRNTDPLQSNTIRVNFYSASGDLLHTDTTTIPPNGFYSNATDLTNVFTSIDYTGSVVINSAAGIVVVSNHVQYTTGADESCAGITTPTTHLVAPRINRSGSGGYTSVLYLQNSEAVATNVNITYVAYGSGQNYTQSLTLPGHGMTTVNLATSNTLPPGFYGSADIRADRAITAITEENKAGEPGALRASHTIPLP